MLRKATEIGNTLSQRNRIGKTLDYEDQGPKLAERSVRSRQLARIKDARLKLQNTQKDGLIRAISLITWPGLVGPVVGPAIGGFLTTYATWHWIFFINIPIGIIGIIFSFILLEEKKEKVVEKWFLSKLPTYYVMVDKDFHLCESLKSQFPNYVGK